VSTYASNLRAGRRVAMAGIAASAVLAVVNITVGLLTRSTSVLATGAEFAGDVLASGVVLAGMIVAARPADHDHPYGHGRVESLAALAVSGILMLGGAAISYGSLQAVGEVHPPPGRLAVVALAVAIVVRASMSALKFRVGRRIQSLSLVADAWNDTVDILSAVAALTAVALTTWDPARFMSADHYGGFAVGVVVAVTGVRVMREASLELIDTMPDRELIEQIRGVASAVPGVGDVEKGYARKTGLRYHVDLHIHVAPSLTAAESHEIAGHVRSEIKRRLPWVADVLVHVEPTGS
jgi:cation diffusion facilitator family transporter